MDRALIRDMAAREASHWWFVGKGRMLRRLIARFAPAGSVASGGEQPGPGLRSLDVGCGGGGLLAWLSERGEAWGMDVSEDALAICRDKGLNVQRGALPDDVPFEEGKFDVVVASDVIEHVEDDRSALARLVSLTRPGGVLVFTVPAYEWMWSRHDEAHGHFRRYTRRRFLALFEGQPVTIERASYCNTALFPLMAAARVGSKVASRLARRERPVEVKPPPRVINGALAWIFGAEGAVVERMALPYGGSVVVVVRRA